VTGRRIAVLGGGMLGLCTALELTRRGKHVTLIEGATDIMQGASRWNEGKIHLGYLYAADPSFNTATRIIPGGLAFVELLEHHLCQSLDAFTTEDDVFLVHRGSVVSADSFASYAARVSELVRQAASRNDAPRYLTDVRNGRVHRLAPSQLAEVTSSSDVVAGFRVPERSVSTVPIADLLCRAVRAEPRIELHVATRVEGVHRRDDGRMDVAIRNGADSAFDGFDVVVNALWEGRPAIDASLGVMPPAPWSHRFRVALFAHAPRSRLRSAVLCTGPFGDVKRYADGRLYLSWYQAGLLAEGHAIEPPRDQATLTPERQATVKERTLAALADYFPRVADLPGAASELEVHGGWVYAIGQGSLADRASTLHQRDKFAVSVDRGYISVDTAKYSLAPWLAERVAGLVAGS
jgi:glycine/D-amino acid oxidase-like deaminating enzyme